MEAKAHTKLAKRRSRPATDWEEAFAYYASLPPSERSYAAVASRLGVSRRTVEGHGYREHWKQRLRAIEQEAARRTQESLISGRVEEVQKIQQLIDESLLGYAKRLQDGMRMTPADLERMNRLSRALLDEIDETASAEASAITAEPPERTVAHAEAVITALARAGALEALGLTYTPVASQPDGEGVS
jgi:hypothetical protein